MWHLIRMLAWRSKQPPYLRWAEACILFGCAFALRFSLGKLQGAIPFLTFYPAILAAALFLGWKEAAFVLGLSLAAGTYFFLPPNMSLLPLGWLFLGTVNIGIIIVLKELAQDLALSNERQRALFQELQHRVANTLQVATGKLQAVRSRMDSSPAEATNMLDETIKHMLVIADMHRRLHDPTLFDRGLEPMLREVVTAIIDDPSVSLRFNIENLDLSLDQMSIIAMLAAEIANNSLKHVFHQKVGSRLDVVLHAVSSSHAMLRIKDDGPGTIFSTDVAWREQKLGMRVLQSLTDQHLES
jgi:two-component sensor histidine kinase